MENQVVNPPQSDEKFKFPTEQIELPSKGLLYSEKNPLSKGVIENGNSKPRIRAISLSNDIGFITATSNDDSYDNIFVNQLITLANEGDSLFVISGSGNSENVVRAVDYAELNGIKTYGILGYDGGVCKSKVQKFIHINYNHMETCESVMSIILHYVMCELKTRHENYRLARIQEES